MKVLKEVSWKLLFKFKGDNGENFCSNTVIYTIASDRQNPFQIFDIDKEPIIFQNDPNIISFQ